MIELARLREIKAEREAEELKASEAKKNSGFVQVYPKGFARLESLCGRQELRLYIFIAKHMDDSAGIVFCDQDFLAKKMGVAKRTIIRWVKYLEDAGAIFKIRIGSGYNGYAINPLEFWKGYDNNKSYAVFNTKTLSSKNKDLEKKIKVMIKKQEKMIKESSQ